MADVVELLMNECQISFSERILASTILTLNTKVAVYLMCLSQSNINGGGETRLRMFKYMDSTQSPPQPFTLKNIEISQWCKPYYYTLRNRNHSNSKFQLQCGLTINPPKCQYLYCLSNKEEMSMKNSVILKQLKVSQIKQLKVSHKLKQIWMINH